MIASSKASFQKENLYNTKKTERFFLNLAAVSADSFLSSSHFTHSQCIFCATNELENEDRKLLELQKLFLITEILKVAVLSLLRENRLS